MKKIIFALILCIVFYQAKSQNIKTLGIGDTLPLINVQVINGDQVEIRPLSSFYKNTFLILDFWANWCGPCIAAIAEADSVAKKFNGQVNVLPITYQDAGTIRNFIKSNSMLNKLELNYVTNDTVLMGRQISFKILPHEVWIDTNGIIKAITYPDEITPENIEKFIQKETLTMIEKLDILDFDLSKPLSDANNDFLYRSILTTYKQGVSNSIGAFVPAYIKEEKIQKFSGINVDLLSLFYAAYSHSKPYLYFNRIELNIRDSVALSPFLKENNPSRKLLMKNTYCYELILSEKISQDIFYSYLLQDLNRTSKYKASIVKRKKECWIIVNTSKSNNPPLSALTSRLIWERGTLKSMENISMEVLQYYLNWNMKLPVIDETGFRQPFDMDFNFKAINVEDVVAFDIESVKSSLRKYGFDIKKGKRYVDILVIDEK